jgi:hypothetical protein
MADLVQLTKDKDIAIITIDNPPVNALSPSVTEGISEALDQIAKDASAFRMASPQVFCGWKWPGTDPARSALVEQPRVYLCAPPRQRCQVARISRL